MIIIEKVNESVNYIMNNINISPQIAIILGSGLGDLADQIENKTVIKYSNIPNFPQSTVEGHEGKLITGKLGGKDIIAMKGRFHFYEGYSMNEVVFPIRVFIKLGIKRLLVTNASGGINKEYDPGDLMIIKDHIKFFDDSPLRGKNIDELGPRFNDMSDAYSKRMREVVIKLAKKNNITIREGVYGFMPGPSYETPAEINMLRIVGADAVGMSTVPEVITAVHAGLEVIGISCITNMAAGVLDRKLSHEEVVETADKVKDNFALLVKEVISSWSE